MGHQEIKLAVAGLTEDQIAALDGDWSEFTVAERAAFHLARRLTHEPHRMNDDDINAMRKHYSDLQILEMIMSVAMNNSINRWKEAIGVPQEANASSFARLAVKPSPPDRPLPLTSFLTPTSDKFKTQRSSLAPTLPADVNVSVSVTQLIASRRPPLETREAVERALAISRTRQPRLPLASDEEARAVLPDEWMPEPLPQWVRLLANFPRDGKNRIVAFRMVDEQGSLAPKFKSQIRWIAARQDRAWYALGLAKQRLAELGCPDDEIYRLDDFGNHFTAAERTAFAFARKLIVAPDLLADADVVELRQHYCDRDLVQFFSFLASASAFNRITEGAGLRLEK